MVAKYILQPYWTWLVTLFPEWMAPNLITLLGLVFILINVATILCYVINVDWQTGYPLAKGQVEMPWYVYASFGVGLFAYTSFDAIDGKQARRTQTSSPLGELFDHGTDALNTYLGCIILAYTLSVANTWGFPLFVAVSLGYFYLSTWETYHRKTLYLGVINGPVEGTLGLCFVYFLTAYLSPEFWLTKVSIPFAGSVFQVQTNHLGLSAPAVVIFAVMLSSIFRVRSYYRAKNRPEAFVDAMVDVLPIVLLLGIAFLWLNFGQMCTVFEGRDENMWMLLVFSLAIGLEVAMMVGKTITAHLLHTHFPRFFIGLPFLILPAFGLTLTYLTKDELARKIFLSYEPQYLCFYCALIMLAYVHFVLTVINQFCAYLDINCLTIKKRFTQQPSKEKEKEKGKEKNKRR